MLQRTAEGSRTACKSGSLRKFLVHIWSHFINPPRDSYNSLLEVLLRHIAEDPQGFRIIVATHNEESVRRAAEW